MKKIKLFLDPILFYMEDTSGFAVTHYIDLTTGEVVSPDLDDDISDEDVKDGKRYFFISPIGSHEGYGIMKDFVGTIESEEIQNRLYEALERRKPFRSFKNAVSEYPDMDKLFYEYKGNRLINMLKERLAGIGYEVEEDLKHF